MKFFEPNESQTKKMVFFGTPLVTYILALFSGLWWLDDDLLRGVIFLCGLYVYSYQTGYKTYFSSARYYFYFTYAIPIIIGTVLFTFGFL